MNRLSGSLANLWISLAAKYFIGDNTLSFGQCSPNRPFGTFLGMNWCQSLYLWSNFLESLLLQGLCCIHFFQVTWVFSSRLQSFYWRQFSQKGHLAWDMYPDKNFSSTAFDLLFRGFFLFSTILIDSGGLVALVSKIKWNLFKIKH